MWRVDHRCADTDIASKQPSPRQLELERVFNERRGQRGHVPNISITDANYHPTEVIGSYYGDERRQEPVRPLSFMPSASSEVYESKGKRRGGGYFDPTGMDTSPVRDPLARTRSNEKVTSPLDERGGTSPKSPRSPGSMHRMGSGGRDGNGGLGMGPTSPPPLKRNGSSETAVQHFPLNDIDYESSPAAVAQELSNLQAIRRMSMNVDMADPDLPSFASGVVPAVAPGHDEDEDDTSRLFWVPARLHPELAPKEFKTFVEDRVDKIRRRSGDSDSLSVDGLDRSGSGSSSLRRKKSMLSHSIDTKGNYEDGADRLDRKRSRRMHVEGQTTVDSLSELEALVNDPVQLMRRMSIDTVRKSQDSGIEVPPSEAMPMLPPVSQSLKRSTRTTYRRGSVKNGERVPYSKRALQRRDSDVDDTHVQSPVVALPDEREPILGLTRVQTEPTPPSGSQESRGVQTPSSASTSRRRAGLGASQSSENLIAEPVRQSHESTRSLPAEQEYVTEEQQSRRAVTNQPPNPQAQPAQRQFQSRLASGQGRTTAQLPGYNNQNPLPHIIETLPDGTKVPVGQLAQSASHPERKSSHEYQRPVRGGAHMRPVPGRQSAAPNSTLDDISSHPSPLPGSGSTRTDALTMVPTFEDHKADKKDAGRKSSWKWILGSDDDDKEKKAKEEKAGASGLMKSKSSRLNKPPGDKARLDVLQNSIDGTPPVRGRESLVLNREDLKLDEERKKETKKLSEPKKEKEKDSGLLSAIFGGKKKTSESDLKAKKRKSDRGHSPDPIARVLKPDIDYNWTRFSILEERAIYRMAHIKLANPRRALYSQVLLSNFMYSYLAKVQMMHPQQMQIPQQRAAQQRQKEEQPAEYSQYQRYQEVRLS